MIARVEVWGGADGSGVTAAPHKGREELWPREMFQRGLGKTLKAVDRGRKKKQIGGADCGWWAPPLESYEITGDRRGVVEACRGSFRSMSCTIAELSHVLERLFAPAKKLAFSTAQNLVKKELT